MEIVSRKVINDFLIGVQKGNVAGFNIKLNLNKINETYDNALTPILRINNIETFHKAINDYVVALATFENTSIQVINEEYILEALVHLFANATTSELNNPEIFIYKYIDFMKNSFLSIQNVPGLFDSVIDNKNIAYNSSLNTTILKQSKFQETPFVFVSSIDNDNLRYELPRISYGISDNVCYIYAIQNKKETAENDDTQIKFQKTIKRLLYKLDSDVLERESEEYIDYKNGNSTYYPENISDVVPSAILALSLFLKTLYNNNINQIRVVSYLPVRYNAKKEAYEKRIAYQKERLTDEELKHLINQYKEEHLKIQNNLTQKLLRNFLRLQYHFPNIEIDFVPFEIDECMYLTVNQFSKTNNAILEEIIKNNNHKSK